MTLPPMCRSDRAPVRGRRVRHWPWHPPDSTSTENASLRFERRPASTATARPQQLRVAPCSFFPWSAPCLFLARRSDDLWLAGQNRNAVRGGRRRYRHQERIDVGEFLVGNDFGGIRRHLPRRSADISREGREGNGTWSQPRPRATLGGVPMALITPVARVELLSILDITLGRRGRRALGRRSGRRPRALRFQSSGSSQQRRGQRQGEHHPHHIASYLG